MPLRPLLQPLSPVKYASVIVYTSKRLCQLLTLPFCFDSIQRPFACSSATVFETAYISLLQSPAYYLADTTI
jgi:hypothetical protein